MLLDYGYKAVGVLLIFRRRFSQGTLTVVLFVRS